MANYANYENLSRDDLIFIAQLNENAERYEEMVETMKQIAARGDELSEKERNLLSVAYKNVIGPRRAGWRVVSSIEAKERSRSTNHAANAKRLDYIRNYRLCIEKELEDICNDILKLISDSFLPVCTNTEGKVFFLKMQGDYYRYLAEFAVADQKQTIAQNALVAYKTASQIAEELPPTHPIRLGLALNFSVYYFEILNAPDNACQLARKAFDDAITDLDRLTEESYKDSTLILHLLRDNLNLWLQPGEDNGADVEQPAAAAQ